MTFELSSLGLKVENVTDGLLNITPGDGSRESELLNISKFTVENMTYLISSESQDYRPWNTAISFIFLSIVFNRSWADLCKALTWLTLAHWAEIFGRWFFRYLLDGSLGLSPESWGQHLRAIDALRSKCLSSCNGAQLCFASASSILKKSGSTYEASQQFHQVFFFYLTFRNQICMVPHEILE